MCVRVYVCVFVTPVDLYKMCVCVCVCIYLSHLLDTRTTAYVYCPCLRVVRAVAPSDLLSLSHTHTTDFDHISLLHFLLHHSRNWYAYSYTYSYSCSHLQIHIKMIQQEMKRIRIRILRIRIRILIRAFANSY